MLKRCKEAFVLFDNGVPFTVNAGDIVDSSDLLYTSNIDRFEDIAVTKALSTATRNVPLTESASAAPGEKREVSVTRFARKSDA